MDSVYFNRVSYTRKYWQVLRSVCIKSYLQARTFNSIFIGRMLIHKPIFFPSFRMTEIWILEPLAIFMHFICQFAAFLANYSFYSVIKTISIYSQVSLVGQIKPHYIKTWFSQPACNTNLQTVCSKHVFYKFHYLNLYLPWNFPQALSTLSNGELSDHPRKGIDGDSTGQMSPPFPSFYWTIASCLLFNLPA